MKQKIIYFVWGWLAAGLLVMPKTVLAASTTVTSWTPVAQSVGRYEKFEASFNISRTFAADSLLPYYYYDPQDNATNYPGRSSPYGADGITVDVHFTAPSGKQLVVPAFYYQDYTRSGSYANGETMTAGNNYVWKVRFAPEETGSYSYFVTVEDKDGNSRYPVSGNLSFSSVSSNSKGFVQPSARDSRFLDFSNGTSFVPISSGRQWWVCCGKRSFDYEQTFSDFAQNGINLTRIWDQNDGYGLTVEGHFDAYGYPVDYNPEGRLDLSTLPKGTQINQRGAFEEDKIIEAAQKDGVYIQLTSHEDPYWIWDASVHNESWNPYPTSYTDPLHVNYWKRNFRYRVARWGYSTAILAWETWNEHGHVLPGSDIYNFYQTYGSFQTATDPYHHIRTTSQGSQAYSPAFWASPAFDLANYHNYMMGWYSDDLKNDAANFVYKTAWCLQPQGPSSVCQYLGLGDGTAWSGNAKPWIWGEIDVGTNNWNEVNPLTKTGEGRLRELHNSMWAGLFSPLGTTPIDWYWNTEDNQTTAAKYAQKKVASAFFSDIDYAGDKFVYLMSDTDKPNGYTGETVTVSDPNVRVYAMRRGDNQGAYVWVQNRQHTWANSPNIPAPVNPSVTIGGLNSGSYNAQYWDAYTGQIIDNKSLQTNGNSLSFVVSNLTSDVAVKIIPVSITQSGGVTPTPTTASITPATTNSPTSPPSATTEPTATGNGDVNGDGIVNSLDVLALLNEWSTSPSQPEQYADGQINSLDFAVVKSKLISLLTPTPEPTIPPTATPIPIPTTSPVPTPIPGADSGSSTGVSEWSQFGHDPQNTNYTADAVSTPWKYKWQWNGAGSDGKKQANHLSVPDLVQPITGGGRVYMVAGNGVYALNKDSGSVIWNRSDLGGVTVTPAYDSESLYVASGNGNLYRLDAGTGMTKGIFAADSGLNQAPTIANNVVLFISNNGTLYAVDKNNLGRLWSYAAGSPAATPPAFSEAKNTVIFVSQDLYVHAVNASDGTRKWRVKPTTRNYSVADAESNLTEAAEGWPVIAEQHGIVFIRYRLEWQTLWDGAPFPTTNVAIRSYLTANPKDQALFALNMDTGQTAFVPAVGNGGQGDGGVLSMGPQPVIRSVGGKEVAYIIWRNQLTCLNTSWCDGREDATMGEMVLDNNTVSGYEAGDVRFVQFQDIQTDEMLNLTMAGPVIFHNHWLASEAQAVTDRSAGLGDTFANPIKTSSAPYIIWRQVYCPPTNTQCNPQIFPGGTSMSYGPSNCQFDTTHRYCSAGLYSYGDQRSYPPGFYEYFNDENSGSTAFTIESANLVLVKTQDGGLIALENGNPLASTTLTTSLAQALPTAEVLGTTSARSDLIDPGQAKNYLGQNVIVAGTIVSAQSHMPKALYLTLSNGHGGDLLVRIFAENLKDFDYDPLKLVGKKVEVSGTVDLYWPENINPEIVVSSPTQITLK